MYRKPHVNQLAFENFVLPFGRKLRSDNRWVILAKQIPWSGSRNGVCAAVFPRRYWVASQVVTIGPRCFNLKRAPEGDGS